MADKVNEQKYVWVVSVEMTHIDMKGLTVNFVDGVWNTENIEVVIKSITDVYPDAKISPTPMSMTIKPTYTGTFQEGSYMKTVKITREPIYFEEG